MKKSNLTTLCAAILAVLLLCSGCTAALQNLENAEARQITESMLDALIANDFQKAYSLVSKGCTEADFQPVFTQMRDLLGDVDVYELTLLSVYTNFTVSNGQENRSVRSVYEMAIKNGSVIVSIQTDSQNGLTSFYLTPYEKTDYYFTGTLKRMKDAVAIQWVFLLGNLIAIGFTVFALVDCCRHKIRKKVLWILLLVLGFCSFGVTLSSTGFRMNINLGWLTAYSALIRYGSGTVILRMMLPLGAIIYFAMRHSLLNQNTAASECKPQTQESPISDQP